MTPSEFVAAAILLLICAVGGAIILGHIIVQGGIPQ